MSERTTMRPNTMPCPHCGSRSRTLKTQQVSEIVREVMYACRNDECGHIFMAQIAVTKTLSPSACPNPDIKLPA